MKATFLLSFLFFKVAVGDLLNKHREINKVFTYSLYQIHSTTSNGSNFVFSPILTQNVLALAAIGAGEKTAREIIEAAYLPKEFSTVTDMYSQVQNFLSSTSSVSIYNTIFGNINELNDDYKYLTKTAFNTVITSHDLKNVDLTTCINLLAFSDGKRITSHLNLNISWIHHFLPYESLMRFTHIDKTEDDIEMVHAKTPALLSEDTAGKVYFIEFPFVNDNLLFTLVFPKKSDDFLELEKDFYRLFFDQIKQDVLLNIVLPHFRIHYSVEIKSMLESLGINLAFSEDADFSEIENFPQNIVEVYEETVFNITEISVVESSKDDNLPTVNFNITHPFIYFLRHKELGILIVGRFVKPTRIEDIQ